MLATVSGGESVAASIHCSHETPDTTLTWFRDGKPLNYTNNRILLDNGTVEFRALIAMVDVSPEGVKYQCMLSNAFGSVISRTALLQSACKLCINKIDIIIVYYTVYKRKPYRLTKQYCWQFNTKIYYVDIKIDVKYNPTSSDVLPSKKPGAV